MSIYYFIFIFYVNMLIKTLYYHVTRNIYCEEHDSRDAKVFLNFLKAVLLQYLNENIVILTLTMQN